MSNKVKEVLKKFYIEHHMDSKWYKPNEPIDDADLKEFLRDADVVNRKEEGGSRWWNNEVIVAKIGDRYFEYADAYTTGDMSPEEAGWEFDWSTVDEVEPYKEIITVTKYRRK